MYTNMSETYQLVHNEDEIKQFFNFLHDSNDLFSQTPRQVITQILARKKYSEEISKSTRQIIRRLNRIYTGKDLVKILRKYEVKDGLYSCKDINHNEYVLKSENLAVYSTINKLDPFKAAKKLISSIHGQMFEACTNGNVQNLHAECGNIDRNFTSNMMASAGYDFIHFDIDEKDVDTLLKIENVYDSITSDLSYKKPKSFLVETTHGYHLLVDVRKEEHKTCIQKAHKFIPTLKYFEISITDKGSPCPIPGTYQAGFPVRVIHKTDKTEPVNPNQYAEDKGRLWC